jgi:hypothetical protein
MAFRNINKLSWDADTGSKIMALQAEDASGSPKKCVCGFFEMRRGGR